MYNPCAAWSWSSQASSSALIRTAVAGRSCGPVHCYTRFCARKYTHSSIVSQTVNPTTRRSHSAVMRATLGCRAGTPITRALQPTYRQFFPTISGSLRSLNFSTSCHLHDKQEHSGRNESIQNNSQTSTTKSALDNNLNDNIYTIPNLLCVGRAAASPFIASMILSGNTIGAFGLLFVAGVTDMFDGMIARKWPSQASRFGTALDPICDKFLMTVVVVSEANMSLMPWQLAAVIIGRDVGLLIGGLFYRYKSLDAPVTTHKFFNASHGTTEFHPTMLGKVNTCLQLALIGSSLVYPSLGLGTTLPLEVFQWSVGATTVLSGAQYLTSNTAVKIHKSQVV
eukprot:CFRG5878T1